MSSFLSGLGGAGGLAGAAQAASNATPIGAGLSAFQAGIGAINGPPTSATTGTQNFHPINFIGNPSSNIGDILNSLMGPSENGGVPFWNYGPTNQPEPKMLTAPAQQYGGGISPLVLILIVGAGVGLFLLTR